MLFDRPHDLTPDQRRLEVAQLLARGLLRLRQRRRLSGNPMPDNIPLESSAEGLEVPAETVLSVHTG
ncbi:hypothetical protein ETAA8_39470 [Anatilimnocola aggregata]|uniref:Uncharacterized protein n=1 Tax=Anatilimnocola aggregata TaxID=2528021 RepID=A0A517YFC0_9BACT|nr:hypothetical protein [Anatilimnocola aggregata]QDU28842.1 hypothetical protein ETAA8_39470 [Anatilimnocola aggregata]